MTSAWASTESVAALASGYGHGSGRPRPGGGHLQEKRREETYADDEEDEGTWSDGSRSEKRGRRESYHYRCLDGPENWDRTHRPRLLTERRSPSPSRSRQRNALRDTRDSIRLLLPPQLSTRDQMSDGGRSGSYQSSHSSSSRHRAEAQRRKLQVSRSQDGRSRDHSPASQALGRVWPNDLYFEDKRKHQDSSPHQPYGRNHHRDMRRNGGSKYGRKSETSSRRRDSTPWPRLEHVSVDELSDIGRRHGDQQKPRIRHYGRSEEVQEGQSSVPSYSRTESVDENYRASRTHRQQKRSPSPPSNRGKNGEDRGRYREDAMTEDDHHSQHNHRRSKDDHERTPSALEAAVRNALRAGTLAALDCHDSPGDWLGDKGTRVATAALKAAIVDTYMEHRHPQKVNGIRHTAMRHAAEYAITNALAGPLMQFAAEERRRRR
ncbi:hypothetical protein CMQ_562 [Grosmannia clavigera kw1407]|uniref:Uncharacterized protein n=1 Tax=Grosmannia clavigera (strain kw1407 / UAMH 11150) TaxID=655863 RepID=F0XES4_GROCL|nr:uncharacterized protein CMQ_562 [Grosmannia clavigera kw1407]EFX03634.1 hypothetical protein CMQ_562 [Grosmannia clavigera kw1407]